VEDAIADREGPSHEVDAERVEELAADPRREVERALRGVRDPQQLEVRRRLGRELALDGLAREEQPLPLDHVLAQLDPGLLPEAVRDRGGERLVEVVAPRNMSPAVEITR